jgi:serine/threonine-protein kinase HipA
MSDSVDVWFDADFVVDPIRVGALVHDRGAVRFTYDPKWLQHPLSFALDPDLSLGEGAFHPRPDQGNFRVFDDSAPDRWGQMLMKRREALNAKDERRTARTLYAWDFLLGVQDLTRQGALRFQRAGESRFLADEPHAAPPVASLRELESVAREITAKRLDDLDALRRWWPYWLLTALLWAAHAPKRISLQRTAVCGLPNFRRATMSGTSVRGNR